MVIGIVAVVAIAAIVGAFLIGRGSGDEKGSTAATTATQTTQTQAQTQAQTVTQTVTEAAPPAPASNIEIVEQSVNPAAPAKGTPILCTARTKGDAKSVKMNLAGKAGFFVDLNKGPTINGITNWTQNVAAPDLAGAYKYSAMVTDSNDNVTEGPATPFTVLP